jgi:hypothetical protein
MMGPKQRDAGLKRRSCRMQFNRYIPHIPHLSRRVIRRLFYRDVPLSRPSLAQLAEEPEQLPRWVRDTPLAMRYLRFLEPLDWTRIPSRALAHDPPIEPLPYEPFLAACLVKVDQQIRSMARLRQCLVENPALTWVMGFPLVPSSAFPWGFDVEASLPSQRHFARMLRTIPNDILQRLLDSSVTRLKKELPPDSRFGEAISLDTKHILAWVKENNPKAYVTSDDRYDKNKQPKGDPDCRLGCKKRRNQHSSAQNVSFTPTTDPVPASTVKVGTFYWGYGTGLVATKVPEWGEFVLAELTQPFNCADVTYYFTLMKATTRRLGRHPKFGAFDAAFDAFYVYEDFHSDEHNGFAAVPLANRGPRRYTFDENGRPHCQAGLAMPLRRTFWSKTAMIPHEKGRYGCPLSESETDTCPIQHKNWAKGGCTTTLPTSIGARLRHQIDRESAEYKAVYKQRTATERVNSQTVELGIERPRLRNAKAIANQNTLIYIVINLRALQRVRRQKGEDPCPSEDGR